MLSKNLILLIIFGSCFSPKNSFCQEGKIEQYIPIVEATRAVNFRGAGIIVGNDMEKTYVITAYHIVQDASQINIKFKGHSKKYKAEILNFDDELDLAVLSINLSINNWGLEKLNIKIDSEIRKKLAVYSIGHPVGNDWMVNDLNTVQKENYYDEPRWLTIQPSGITSGCSGSPVFDNDHQFIGIILKTGAVETPCLRAYAIKKKLKKWNVNSNFIQTTQEWWQSLDANWKKIFTGNSLGNSGIYEDNILIVTPMNPTEKELQKLLSATKIKCKNCKITTLDPMSRMIFMKNLALQANPFISLEPLRNLRHLEKLNCSNTGIKTIEPIHHSPKLKKLKILSTNISKSDRKKWKKIHPKARVIHTYPEGIFKFFSHN